ncbi:MAG: reverse transcriptase/maturase family protein [Candidatus Woykebacteria bacterium]
MGISKSVRTGGGWKLKTFLHLYKEITSLDNLFQAWDEFKKDKRKKKDVGNFERHLEDNIFDLHKELVNKTYKHSAYTGFYVLDPKVRHIHKALVRDRIVHHALFKILNPIFEPTFISDSFSCRENYGTHKGFEKLVKYSRKVSKNYKSPCWVLKCDIRKFFDSVDHKILLGFLEAKIKDPDLIHLFREIVGSYEVEVGKGLPIGNLTSQLFANVYLNPLDQFVKHKLKVKYYVRYTDDFVLLSQDENYLLEIIEHLKNFLNSELKLSLHPNKVSLRKLSQGIDFLGYVSLPYHQVLRTRTKKRIFRKIKEKALLYKASSISSETLDQSIQSYLGVLKHANTYGLEQNLRNKIWFWLQQ